MIKEIKKAVKSVGITVFEEKEVRKVWKNNKWYFAVVDVVQILINSSDVKQYIKKLRQRDKEISDNWGTICTLLEMIAKDGRKRKVMAADLEGMFRIIQSISSSKVEPFKRWLAKVGRERIEEIADPELAVNRAKEIYDKKGYPK
ncbi:MAG: Bro-N domain-containing protein, partial [Spirochaetes bacterium]|nr:Bro-N domain-containing protein [Spirochaetota bacterium]